MKVSVFKDDRSYFVKVDIGAFLRPGFFVEVRWRAFAAGGGAATCSRDRCIVAGPPAGPGINS